MQMTSLERVQTVLAGGVPDRLPVIPQSFLFAAKTIGCRIGQISRSPARMAESHRVCQEKYGYDGCVIDVDDATLAEACGARVVYREEDVAVVDEHNPLLNDLREIDDLKLPDPMKDGRLCEWLETSQRLAEQIGDHVFIMGRADQGPFSLLCLLRGTQNMMVDLLEEDEPVIQHALEWATQAHIRFAAAQLQTGVHATSMGDSCAGPNLISPAMYRKYALPCERKVVEALRALPGAYSIHICGDTTGIVGDMGTTGAKILELDWKLDMGVARSVLPDEVVLMGNINPSDPMYTGTPTQVREQIREMVQKTGGRGLIISSGCALGANTRPENMEAMVEAAKLYATRDQLFALRQNG